MIAPGEHGCFSSIIPLTIKHCIQILRNLKLKMEEGLWILLFTLCVCMCVKSPQLHPTLCHPMNCSPPGSSVHGILPARPLEWVAMPSSRGSPQPRDWRQVSHTAGGFCSNIPHVPLKNYKRGLLSSLPFEDPVIYSAQDGVNLFGQSLEGQFMPTPLASKLLGFNCWLPFYGQVN